MNTFEAICSRKSVRSYTGELPSREETQKILTAAYAAPVGMGAYDSLALTVVTNKELLGEIDKNCGALMKMPDRAMLYGAPMLIVISSKLDPALNDNTNYSNAAIIAHNMALEAVELGLGACYIWGAVFAINQAPELVKKLGLPEGFTPCCAVSLGKTDYRYTLREIPADRIKTRYID